MASEMLASEGKCVSTGQRMAAILLGGVLLLWAPPAWAQYVQDQADFPDRDHVPGTAVFPPGEMSPRELWGALEMPADEPRAATAAMRWVNPARRSGTTISAPSKGVGPLTMALCVCPRRPKRQVPPMRQASVSLMAAPMVFKASV